MKALEQLAESEPRPEWRPLGEMGKALKRQESLLRDLVLKGHGNRAIHDAWGFEDDDRFDAFVVAMSGLRGFMRREESR